MAPYENTRLRARMAELAAKNKNQSGAVPDSPSPFFRLPGEIRNKIYSYALHCPTNLFYYPVGWLELTKFPPRICALTRPWGEMYIRLYNCPWFNQLQFVNRQLRSEARWQELRHNVLDITNTWTTGFESFPWTLGPEAVRCMDTLLIRAFSTYKGYLHFWPTRTWVPFGVSRNHFQHSIAKLVNVSQVFGDFCRRNPHIKLNFVEQYFDICPPAGPESLSQQPPIEIMASAQEVMDVWQIIRFGVFFESVIRAKQDAAALLPLNRGRPELMRVIAKYREGGSALYTKEREGIVQLPVLRIFPALERWKPNERARVENALREDGLSDQSIEQWFERVEGWMRDGI